MNLKEHRKRKGMTQGEVAEYLGVPVKTYQNYEREIRKPGLGIMCRLADLYGVSLDELYGRQPIESCNHLKEIRKRAGITQAQLADALGVTEKTVSNWESGNNDMTGKYLAAVCDYLQVTPDQIYGVVIWSEELDIREKLIGIFNGLSLADKRLLLAMAQVVENAPMIREGVDVA